MYWIFVFDTRINSQHHDWAMGKAESNDQDWDRWAGLEDAVSQPTKK